MVLPLQPYSRLRRKIRWVPTQRWEIAFATWRHVAKKKKACFNSKVKYNPRNLMPCCEELLVVLNELLLQKFTIRYTNISGIKEIMTIAAFGPNPRTSWLKCQNGQNYGNGIALYFHKSFYVFICLKNLPIMISCSHWEFS